MGIATNTQKVEQLFPDGYTSRPAAYTFQCGRQTFYIPQRMMSGIKKYVEYGVKPGSFLSAIICNDLKTAVGKADGENIRNLPAYVAYFYNETPGECWGSRTAFKAWIQAGGINASAAA